MTDTPKHLYQQVHSEVSAKMAELSQDRVLRITTTFAYAQMAYEGVTKEQLDGAKRYAQILMTMGDPPQKQATFPEKGLTTLG